MSSEQEKKTKLVKTIHSLLIAGGAVAVTLRELEKDYRDIIGARIPFKDLGYPNVEAFLRDCRHDFKLYWNGPILMVKHVSNEQTSHIEHMINMQKKKPKRKNPRSMSSSHVSSFGRRYPKPQHQPQPARMEPTVTSIVRGKIKGLLYDYRTGLLGSNFDVAYAKRFGGQIAFREFGFDSLYDMFKSMPDIVDIEQQPSGIYKLYPKSLGRPSAVETPSTERNNNQWDEIKHDDRKQEVRRLADNRQTYDRQHENRPPADGGRRDRQPPDRHKEHRQTEDRQRSGPRQGHKSSVLPPAGAEEDLWDDNPYDTSGINIKLQKEIQQVLAKFPDGVWASHFPAEYRIMFRCEMDRRSQGYDSVIALMSALPHLVSIQRPTQKDWLLFDARIQQQPKHSRNRKDSGRGSSDHNEQPSCSTAPPISNDLQETIRQVVHHYQAGVLLDELPAVYQELTGDMLDPEEMGYATLESLVTSASLADVINLEYQQNLGKILLFPQYKENPPRQDMLKNLHVTPPVVGSGHKRREIPADAVGPGAVYRQQELPQSIFENDMKYVEIFVSTVTNPGNLWIQLKGESTTESLENLMDCLEDLYQDREKAEEYTLPEELVRIGQICAAVYPNDGDWHRCTITSFREMDFVEVYYVDYGSTYVVSKKSLKFLQMRFLKLPAQAIRAKLANIKPKDAADWSQASKERLLKVVSNRPLIALITDISRDNELSVCLTDTSTDKDVHINDLLVMEGLAEMEVLQLSPETVDREPRVRRSTEVSSVARSEPASEDAGSGQNRIKHVQLTDEYNFHIINHDNKPCVTSTEVSNLLWPGKDVLRSMMRQRRINLPKIVLPQEENAQLFEEFQTYDVDGTMDSDNVLKTHVTVFELSSVQRALDIFNHPSEELKAAITRQMDLFNPEDGYWKGLPGSDDLEDDLESDPEDDYEYGRQTLEMALQSLQFRRKKILQAMQQMDATNSEQLVEDLQKVERQLGDIKNRIKLLEQLERTEGSVKSGGSKKMTQEEQLICTVVSEQHDSYVEKNKRDLLQAMPTSPMAKVTPMPSATPKPGVKTIPVAPMPAEPRPVVDMQPQPANPQVSLGADLTGPMMANPMMMMPFGAAGSGDSELLRQQMMLQYQYNFLAMQSMLQQHSLGGIPSAAGGYPLGVPSFTPGSGMGRGTASETTDDHFGSSLGLGSPSLVPSGAYLGHGRGRSAAASKDFRPGANSAKE